MMVSPNTLYILSGLPGVGKTTLAKSFATHTGATYLRIDTIEQALKDLCKIAVEGEGYRLAYRVATDNLALGLSVIADSCNTIELTRREWENVAKNAGTEYRNIEVICSDANEHRRRIENRKPTIQNHKLPNWQNVLKREYDAWHRHRLLIDTTGRTPEESLSELIDGLSNYKH